MLGTPGRLPAAVASRPRLPEGRHEPLRAVPRRALLRAGGGGRRERAAAGRARVRRCGARGARTGRRRAGRGRAERAAGTRGPARGGPRARPPGVGRAAAGGRAARRRARAVAAWCPARADRPARPSRPATHRAVRLDLAGARGHVALVGAPRTGKSTALRTLAAALILGHTRGECSSMRSTSAAASSLPLAAAPHVGGVAGKLDREAVLARGRAALRADRGPRGAVPRARLGGHGRRPRGVRRRPGPVRCSSTAGRRSSASSRAWTARSRSSPRPA